MKPKKKKPFDFKEIQEKIKSGEVTIEIAETNHGEEVYDFAYDMFIPVCLNRFGDCLITDLSLVSDFLDDEDEYNHVIQRCQDNFGVDITPVVKDYIVNIAEFILKEQKRG